MKGKDGMTHYAIFNYWKDKCITDGFKVEIEGTVDYNRCIAVVNDWGEPECWACGKYGDRLYNFFIDNDLIKLWNHPEVKSSLQKCHIMARQFGGNDEPNNLFLLCKECHTESPDTKNVSNFFAWFYYKRKTCFGPTLKIKSFLNKANDISAYSNINFQQLLRDCFIRGADVTKIANQVNDRVGSHAGKVQPFSFIYATIDCMSEYVNTHEIVLYLDEEKDKILSNAIKDLCTV